MRRIILQISISAYVQSTQFNSKDLNIQETIITVIFCITAVLLI